MIISGIFDPVLSIFHAILCGIENLAMSILAVLILFVNAVIVGAAAFIGVILLLLPNMPDSPPSPDSGVLGYLNWFIDLGLLISLWSVILGLWVAMLVLRVALKWVRAL